MLQLLRNDDGTTKNMNVKKRNAICLYFNTTIRCLTEIEHKLLDKIMID